MHSNATAIFGVVLAVLLLQAASVFASPVSIEVRDTVTGASVASQPISTCAQPITPKTLSVYITNTGPETDSYTISMAVPDGWEGKIENTVTLASGEEKRLDLLVINPPLPWEVQAGRYTVVITAVSNTDKGHTIMYEVPINILPCYGVSLDAAQDSISVCQEESVSQRFLVNIKNTGKFADTFTIASSQPWAVPSDAELALSAGETKTISVEANTAGLVGQQEIQLAVKSKLTPVEAKETLKLGLDNCYDFSLSIEPQSQEVCINKAAAYKLKVTNIGKEDTFLVSVPSNVKASKASFPLAEGASTEITIEASPQAAGNSDFDIIVRPTKEPSNEKAIKPGFNVLECKSVSVAVMPESASTCSGQNLTYTVTVENTGAIEDAYTLTTTNGKLSKEKLALKPGQSMQATLDVQTLGLTGERIFTVTAKSDTSSATDSAGTTATLDNCYSLQLEPFPKRVRACPGQDAEYSIGVKNSGTKFDTYRITLGNDTKQIAMDPGQQFTFNFTYKVPANSSPGLTEIKATAKSGHLETDTILEVEVKDYNTCYGVQVLDGKPKSVLVYKATAFPVSVKNTGEQAQDYTLSAVGPDWAFTSPETLHLEGGASLQGYFYVEPPLGTPKQKYDVKIVAESKFSRSELPVEVTIVEQLPNMTEPDEAMPPIFNDTNLTGNTSGNMTSNETNASNATSPPITGLLPAGAADIAKVVVVALILIAIIAVLILRLVIKP